MCVCLCEGLVLADGVLNDGGVLNISALLCVILFVPGLSPVTCSCNCYCARSASWILPFHWTSYGRPSLEPLASWLLTQTYTLTLVFSLFLFTTAAAIVVIVVVTQSSHSLQTLQTRLVMMVAPLMTKMIMNGDGDFWWQLLTLHSWGYTELSLAKPYVFCCQSIAW